MNKNLCISFSGGETSAFMTQWLLTHKANEYDEIKVVFANTGEENEQTLEFVDKCDKYYGLNVVYVECLVNKEMGVGVSANIVDFKTAARNGEPFEEMIKKYGIPNISFLHCTRILKTQTIQAYLKSIGWKKYYTAIGIRIDEIDRINENHIEKRYIYPLATQECEMTKIKINRFWREQPFRLELKGYEGNCKVCWKKSLRKLLTIAKENPNAFDNFKRWEKLYEYFVPESQKTHRVTPIRFFRGNLTCQQILEMSKDFNKFAKDDSRNYKFYEQLSMFNVDLDVSNGCTESCEVF